MRLPVSLTSLYALVLCLGSANSAAAAPLAVEWRGPETCDDSSHVQAKAERVLRERGVTPSAVQVDGQVRATAQGYRLRLIVDVAGQRSIRELSAVDCESLIDATAWLLSLAVDASLARPPEPVPAEPAAAPIAEVSDVTPNEVDSEPLDSTPPVPPNDERETVLKVRIGLVTGGLAAGLSGLDWSAGGRVGLELDALLFELTALVHLARSHALEVPAAEATFRSQELNGSGCWRFGGELRAGPCAFLAVLRTEGASSGISARGQDVRVWLASGVSASVGYSLSERFELRFDAGVWLPITARPSFEVVVEGKPQKVSEASAVGGFARLGLDLNLP